MPRFLASLCDSISCHFDFLGVIRKCGLIAHPPSMSTPERLTFGCPVQDTLFIAYCSLLIWFARLETQTPKLWLAFLAEHFSRSRSGHTLQDGLKMESDHTHQAICVFSPQALRVFDVRSTSKTLILQEQWIHD